MRIAPIVVTAAGYEQSIIEAPASITVLAREELQEKRFGSLAEALQDGTAHEDFKGTFNCETNLC